jgi:uncharacterized membrane protein YeaQ/YmgE (transglycosylase-associated protein family)
MDGLIYSLIIGAIAGWISGKFIKGGGYGILLNIILGLIGGVIGGWLFGDFIDGVVGDILKGAIGASLLLFVARLLKR